MSASPCQRGLSVFLRVRVSGSKALVPFWGLCGPLRQIRVSLAFPPRRLPEGRCWRSPEVYLVPAQPLLRKEAPCLRTRGEPLGA